jgi:hypothetical protein
MELAIQPWFPGENVEKKRLCALWAGYGVVYRLSCLGQNWILKHIEFPSDTSVSNQRKIQSYRNECEFYRDRRTVTCKIPDGIQQKITETSIFLLLEDLTPSYPNIVSDLNSSCLRTALDWLAEFHAYHWNSSKYAKKGGYWYLETRLEELENIPRRYQHIKDAAGKIDKQCHVEPFLTIIHGDPKAENILWNAQLTKCAFVDFQYTGRGLGAKDLAYLVCSSACTEDLASDGFLEWYFERLEHHASQYSKHLNGYTLELLREHFDWCLLDFVRFLLGWGRWGNFEWALKRTSRLVGSI